MNRMEFLMELKELMMLEKQPDLATELATIDEWDSMTRLSVLEIFEDSLNKQIDTEDLEKLTTVQQLIDLAGL